MTDEEINFRCGALIAWLRGYGKTKDADILLALKARAETAEKALQEIVDNTSERSLANNIARAALEAKLVNEDELKMVRALQKDRAEATARAEAAEQRVVELIESRNEILSQRDAFFKRVKELEAYAKLSATFDAVRGGFR